MADKKDDAGNKKKKSIIASLDLKNYKAKYTDIYGNGKASEVELDDFLIAEPGSVKEDTGNDVKPKQPINIQKTTDFNDKPNVVSVEEPVEKPEKPEKTERVKDSEFERRVNAEAENDFYDEVSNKNIGATFRSNSVNPNTGSDSIDDEGDIKKTKGNRKLSLREPVKINVRHEIKDTFNSQLETEPIPTRTPLRRTETYGIAISAVTLIYGFSAADKALVFLSLSLLLFLARPIIAAPFGKHSQTVQNLLKGFSMAMFFGSIFFIFF